MLATSRRLPSSGPRLWSLTALRAQPRRARRGSISYPLERGALSMWSSDLDQSRDFLDWTQIRADDALMAAIADGDESAFAGLVRRLTPPLLRFARATLATNSGEAEEVVQEVLVRLWQQAVTWRPDGRIATWAHRVAYRLCIDRLRQRRPSIDIEALEDDLVDPEPLPVSRLTRLEDVRAVQAAVAGLPERQRAAIVLCHYQGLSQAEAAAVMGIGEAAYESLLARGRRRLRATLVDGGE